MKTSLKNIEKIFDFEGLWGIPSKCGLQILEQDEKYIIIVSELYRDNPGTSITQAACTLAKQICNKFDIPISDIIYIEHNPDMNSKLSFYEEEFYLVKFVINKNEFCQPQWTRLTTDEIKKIFTIK